MIEIIEHIALIGIIMIALLSDKKKNGQVKLGKVGIAFTVIWILYYGILCFFSLVDFIAGLMWHPISIMSLYEFIIVCIIPIGSVLLVVWLLSEIGYRKEKRQIVGL